MEPGSFLCPWCGEHPVPKNHLFCRDCLLYETRLVALIAQHRDTYQQIVHARG